jgi:PBP4 family serine-type D-alanyl-D-alanine carboxypeptidase
VKIQSFILAACVFAVGCGPVGSEVGASTSSTAAALPDNILAIMKKPRYSKATWSLLVSDVATGQTFFALNPDKMALTGSTRKLFSVGLALNTLGANRRQSTQVFRQGAVTGGVLNGNLVLVGGGDLSLGGRRLSPDTIQFTNFDHNDANGLGTAILTPQDPLTGLDQLAASIKAAGITSITGEIAVDDRLFEAYRVPNGNLLITPMMLNENQIDVSLTPTALGAPATLEVRPITGFFSVTANVTTAAAGAPANVDFSGNRLTSGVGGVGTVQGTIPLDYRAPLSKIGSLVGTFRVEDPNSFARTAFIEALKRQGIAVAATAVAANPVGILPGSFSYSPDTEVAKFDSLPQAQHAKLVLKVSLNLGANLALSLFGLEKGQRTRDGALAVERLALVEDYGLNGNQFLFPTNGSGTPDSQAAPRAFVQFLTRMSKSPVAGEFQAALPVLGVDGSLATSGTSLPGKGHVFAKPGTTITPGPDGQTLELKAQCLAGYIESKSGRKLAYALMVNDAGVVTDIESDVGQVFEDEGTISSLIYESL